MGDAMIAVEENLMLDKRFGQSLAVATLVLAALLSGCSKESEPSDAPVTAVAEKPAVTGLQRTPTPDGARVFIVSPSDGATVSNPIHVDFGVDGMSIVPAGDNTAHSGHHHLLIDTGMPDPSLPIPADDKHIHFGDGSISTELVLEPGEHTLQLLLGDHLHIPHETPVLSKTITITVE